MINYEFVLKYVSAGILEDNKDFQDWANFHNQIEDGSYQVLNEEMTLGKFKTGKYFSLFIFEPADRSTRQFYYDVFDTIEEFMEYLVLRVALDEEFADLISFLPKEIVLKYGENQNLQEI